MAQHTISDAERQAFITACKNNNISISKTPQKRVSSATIYSRGRRVVITNGLIIKNGSRTYVVSPRVKRVPAKKPAN